MRSAISFREGLSVFGNKFGTLPRTSVGARAYIEPLRSGQQGLIGVEYDLSCARRCGQVKDRFGTISKYLAQEHIFPGEHGVDRNQGHEFLGRVLLQNRAGYGRAAGLLRVFHGLQCQVWKSCAIHPSLIEPVQRFASFVAKRRGQFFFENLEKLAGIDCSFLKAFPDLAEGAHKSGIRLSIREVSGVAAGLSFGVTQHGSQHVEEPGAATVADGIVSGGEMRTVEPGAEGDRTGVRQRRALLVFRQQGPGGISP